MPGMMDTVLNLGLNEKTLEGLVALTGNERFGWDAYRRFVSMFGRIVLGVKAERFDEPLDERKAKHGPTAKDTDLTVEDLKALVAISGDNLEWLLARLRELASRKRHYSNARQLIAAVARLAAPRS
jgi:phosphoenolpyruvate synthase/pyruvate phosphate dikinase